MDTTAVFTSVIGISAPSFFMAIVISYLFGIVLHNYTGLNLTGSWFDIDETTGEKYLTLKNLILPAVLLVLSAYNIKAQELHSRWDELTASEWPKALERSSQTCILPIGILEKHGPHVPIGSDLIQVREWSARATKKEYAVVFPDFFYGQINEARHQPGTFSLPERVVWDLLEATCDEIGRNGFKKIVIVNVHGGNPQMIRYFIQTRLEKQRDYAVFFFDPAQDSVYNRKLAALRKSDPAGDQHQLMAGGLELCSEFPQVALQSSPGDQLMIKQREPHAPPPRGSSGGCP